MHMFSNSYVTVRDIDYGQILPLRLNSDHAITVGSTLTLANYLIID